MTRPRGEVRQLSPCEAAWLGAIIDADGCVVWSGGKWRIRVAATTLPEIIFTCFRLTEVGLVYGNGNGRWWDWVVAARAHVWEILGQIRNYSMKAQKAFETVTDL